MKNYILKGHEPVVCEDILEWGNNFQNQESRRVGADEINGVRVSTVFLGMDHQWGDGPPLLFETMIFGGEHDDYQERYSTWDEAEAGHKRAVALVSASVAGGGGETREIS